MFRYNYQADNIWISFYNIFHWYLIQTWSGPNTWKQKEIQGLTREEGGGAIQQDAFLV